MARAIYIARYPLCDKGRCAFHPPTAGLTYGFCTSTERHAVAVRVRYSGGPRTFCSNKRFFEKGSVAKVLEGVGGAAVVFVEVGGPGVVVAAVGEAAVVLVGVGGPCVEVVAVGGL